MKKSAAAVLMCPPDYFKVESAINPWMEISSAVDQTLALAQWQNLKQTIQKFLGRSVFIINPSAGLPDMVFAADQGIITGETFLQGNFYYPERRRESRFFKQWFKDQGYQIKTLPQDYFFEGGDVQFWEETLLVGYGFRTQMQSVAKIAEATARQVIPLRLVNPWFYHLDTALLVLDEETFLWYPAAFSSASRRQLKSLGVELIEVGETDARQFALNSLVGEKKIVVGQGINGTLDTLARHGWQVEKVDVSEFLKSGGGVHCLVCQL